jgi:hypothetical protein
LREALTALANVAQHNVMQRQKLATVAKIRQLTAQAGATFTNLSLSNLIFMYKQTENIADLILAMVNFNLEFQTTKLVKDGKNEHLRNKYLTLDNILNTVRPILTKHGLVIVQALAGDYLVTTIYHVSGQYIQTDMPFHPMSGNKGTNALQELGGGITYAKRYAISAMLGISTDMDDDGQTSKIKPQELKAKKKVNTIDELQKLLGWLINNPEKQDTYLDLFELTKEQKQFIENNL